MADPPCRMLLYDLQSGINIGSILRVAESFAVPVSIWDPRARLQDPEAREWIADFSCGAWARGQYGVLAATPQPGAGPGRFIATCTRADAIAATDFDFRSDDTVVIGNEYDGLPDALIAAADIRLTIAMPKTHTPKPASRRAIDPTRQGYAVVDGAPVLSAAMAAGILCYAAHISRRS